MEGEAEAKKIGRFTRVKKGSFMTWKVTKIVIIFLFFYSWKVLDDVLICKLLEKSCTPKIKISRLFQKGDSNVIYVYSH